MSANSVSVSNRQVWLVAVLGILGALRLAWPGDVQFINDEPHLLNLALKANEAGTIATTGLVGTKGISYGPFPTWMYQLYLSITTNLMSVAVLQIVVIGAVTALGIILIARSDRTLIPFLGGFAFLSPYLWVYGRDLWDNSMLIPLTALAFGLYLGFVATNRLVLLALAGVLCTFCLLTHLMALPFVIAIGMHFVISFGPDVLKNAKLAATVAVTAAISVVISLPYLLNAQSAGETAFELTPSVESIIFGLRGSRIISALQVNHYVGTWNPWGLVTIAALASLLTVAVSGYGVLVAVRRIRRDGLRTQAIAVIPLATIAIFVVMASVQRLTDLPHYYNGVWIAFFALWWIGMSDLWQRTWARRMFFAQVGILAVFLVAFVGWLHVNDGTRTEPYGPTLANQIEVAEELNLLGSETEPDSTALHPNQSPVAIEFLRRMDSGTADNGDATDYVIVYKLEDSLNGAIVVQRKDGG